MNCTPQRVSVDMTMKLAATCLLFLLYVYRSVELSSDVGEGCSETVKFKPEDELDTSGKLRTFNEKLQEKTFNNKVRLSNKQCLKSECHLDPAGEAVWIAREDLYKHFSIYSDNHGTNTLDGCFCNSATGDDLNRCLKQVREEMITYLDGSFNDNLASIIENDKCQSFVTNCRNI
nr:unnamed protein product [Callosobruchus analis]